MKVHFIAIGGSAMHNLALALQHKGIAVTGSDDEIFEPSRSRLLDAGLLPRKDGWHPDRISSDLDAVIVGMHAREDNPELERARQLEVPVYSYPEFVYEQTREKLRVVIGGSHGKTTITSMILHALERLNKPCDYLVGALLEGFERSVNLEKETTLAILEGDEYLASPIDRRPKFHLYHAHIGLISGIAWDHMNVFPTYENYLAQFSGFMSSMERGGKLVYNREDPEVSRLVKNAPDCLDLLPYQAPDYRIQEGGVYVDTAFGTYKMQVFGRHNLQNMEGARTVCEALGISAADFYHTMESFSGASRRLENIHDEGSFTVFRDFAHAPSKLRATTAAVRERYPQRQLIACIELHTFSSLNHAFLPHYAHTIDDADQALVYFDPEVVRRKKLPEVTKEHIIRAFQREDLIVCTRREAVQEFIDNLSRENSALLLMSSGNWGGGLTLT